jgi:hypothetical protein
VLPQPLLAMRITLRDGLIRFLKELARMLAGLRSERCLEALPVVAIVVAAVINKVYEEGTTLAR